MPNRPSKSLEIHNYKTSVPIVQPAHTKKLQMQAKVYNKSILTYPIRNYKLNDTTKQAIIPKSHLQQLNIIKPNFDWSGALYHAGKHFIPHFDTIHDVVKGIHHGYKWIKNYIGGNKDEKHKMKEKAKMDVVRHMTDKVNTYKAPEKKAFSQVLTLPKPSNKTNNNINIMSHRHPTDRPKDIVQSANQVELVNKRSRTMEKDFAPFKSNNLILDVSTGTYVAGQVLAVIPITSALFDEEALEESDQFTYMSYKKIWWEYLAYFSEASGGGFALVFDPDPKSLWTIGSSGLQNLQRLRMMSQAKQFNVYGTPTTSDLTGSCPLEYLKDLYYINAATGSDGRSNTPGSLIIMAASGFTIASGQEGQFILHATGTYQLRDDAWQSATYESNVYSPSSAALVTGGNFVGYLPPTADAQTGLDLLGPCFWGFGPNSSTTDLKVFTSSRNSPLCSTNPYLNTGAASNNVSNYGVGLTPGTYRLKMKVGVLQTLVGTVLATFHLIPTSNGGTVDAVVFSNTPLNASTTAPSFNTPITNYDGSTLSVFQTWQTLDCRVSVPFNPSKVGYFMNPLDPNAIIGTGSPQSLALVPTNCAFVRVSLTSNATTPSSQCGNWSINYAEATIERLYGNTIVNSVAIDINKMLLESRIKCHKEAVKLSCHDIKNCDICQALDSFEDHVKIKECFTPTNSEKDEEEMKIDENEYKMSILIDIISKNRSNLSKPDQELFNKLKPQLLSTTKNDSVDSYKFKPLII